MKLVLVRHADPDYEKDSLTETGFKEAELLSGHLMRISPDHIYVSPMGRAQATAAPYLKKSGKTYETLDWLHEFKGTCLRPDEPDRYNVCWDWMPKDWTADPVFFDKDHWFEAKAFENTNIQAEYEKVVKGLDDLLEKHGYRRENGYYRAVGANHETVLLVCHFGLISVLLSHLMNVSPMILWHGSCALPSSVTTLYTEERQEGYVNFRMSSFGDLSHLYEAEEEPSFSARFCECFTDDTRH